MVTAPVRRPDRRSERIFFLVMAVLLFATVFLGFARSYFLAGAFAAPLPNRLIHVHGAVFSCWIFLLIVQTSFISARRVDLHRTLGLWGFGLACLMVVLGVLAATDSLRRHSAPGTGPFSMDPRTAYIIPLTDMLLFGTLVFLAYRLRFNPTSHKRLILIATITIMDAAIGRWPFAFISRRAGNEDLCTYVFLLLLMAYDLWSTRKINRVTLGASLFVVVLEQARIPLGQTVAWHSFSGWVLQCIK